jgi:hypothetical protein
MWSAETETNVNLKSTANRRRTVAAASACLFICAYFLNTPGSQTHRPEAMIRFSPQQLSAQVLAAHRTLAPVANNAVWQKAQLQYMAQGDDRLRPLWVIDWDDRNGQPICSTSWDAETGKLLLAEHPVKRAWPRNVPAQSGQAAVRASWGWIKALGVDQSASGWRLTAPPSARGLGWVVTWQANNCRATITLDRWTLDLSTLYVHNSLAEVASALRQQPSRQ